MIVIQLSEVILSWLVFLKNNCSFEVVEEKMVILGGNQQGWYF